MDLVAPVSLVETVDLATVSLVATVSRLYRILRGLPLAKQSNDEILRKNLLGNSWFADPLMLARECYSQRLHLIWPGESS